MVRPKMSKEDRAKQFMPFAALKGYPEALKKMEKITVERNELSEEKADELDRTLKELCVGKMVCVVHYSCGEYVKTTGLVSRIDVDARYIKIVNTKIKFSDIFRLEIIEK